MEEEILPTCRGSGWGDRLRRSLPRPPLRHWSTSGKRRSRPRLPRLGHASGRTSRAISSRRDAEGQSQTRRTRPSLSSRSPAGPFPRRDVVPLVGARRERLAESLGAVEVDLAQDDLTRIEERRSARRGSRRALPRGADGDPRQRAGLGVRRRGDGGRLTRERILEAAEEVLRRTGLRRRTSSTSPAPSRQPRKRLPPLSEQGRASRRRHRALAREHLRTPGSDRGRKGNGTRSGSSAGSTPRPDESGARPSRSGSSSPPTSSWRPMRARSSEHMSRR